MSCWWFGSGDGEVCQSPFCVESNNECFEDAYILIRRLSAVQISAHVIKLGMVNGVSEGPIESAALSVNAASNTQSALDRPAYNTAVKC